MAVDLVVLDPLSGQGWVSKLIDATVVTRLPNYAEERLQKSSVLPRGWEIPYPSLALSQMLSLMDFAELRGMRAKGFLLWDALKNYAVDQPIGTGTGSLATFQLQRTLTDSVTSTVRTIYHPVTSGATIPSYIANQLGFSTAPMVVKDAGVAKTEGTDYDVDYTTGVVTFRGGHIPANGHAITASFCYYSCGRFDEAEFKLAVEGVTASSGPHIIELIHE